MIDTDNAAPARLRLPEKANMTTAEAADYIGLTPGYLRELRMDGARSNRMTPPPFVRLSTRKVIYRKSDLDAWLEAHLVRPGAATEAAA